MHAFSLVTVLSLLVLLSATSSKSQAKDLSQRMGAGYTNQFGLSRDLPSLALRYFPNQNFGVAGAVGVDSEDQNSRFGFMARVMKVVFREDNMNFYIAGSAGLVSEERSGKNDSGFDLGAVFGAEFFLPGLDSLGFNFEGGVGVTSVASSMRFRTIGDSPLRAGMFFYF